MKLKGVDGNVEEHLDGGLDVNLDGATWNGSGLDVETCNDDVRVSMPSGYNAHLETGTVNGHISIDFPVTVQGLIGKSFSTDLGSGGPVVRVRTSNGGVKIMKK